MSNGILFFAYNNETTDYGKIANLNAKLIKKNMLNNSISVVTDNDTKKHLDLDLYDNIIIDEKLDHNTRYMREGSETWKQTNRTTAYNVTPYDKTLVLDVDYFVFSPLLDIYFKLDNVPFACGTKSLNIVTHELMNSMVGKLPMLWATVLYFEKDTYRAEMYFEYMEYVRQNYSYFSELYEFSQIGQYRNDFALTIANKELNMWNDIGLTMALIIDSIPHYENNVRFEDGYFLMENNGRVRYSKDGNVHIMNKKFIFDNYKKIEEWI